jgi:hypothetical protein
MSRAYRFSSLSVLHIEALTMDTICSSNMTRLKMANQKNTKK